MTEKLAELFDEHTAAELHGSMRRPVRKLHS
jgi:hypothetical protein